MSLASKLLRACGGALPPVNTASPTVSGTANVGSVLSCTSGSWTGSPTAYSYQWQYGTTDISGATSSSYTVSATYVGYTLRCKVTATNLGGSTVTYTANTATVGPVTGQVVFTSSGTWTCPAGVTSVSVVCVGQGGGQYYSGGNGGGGLGYKNNIPTVPGNSYAYAAFSTYAGGPNMDGSDSYFINPATVKGGGGKSIGSGSYGGGFTGDGGGSGGSANTSSGSSTGSGGAGGYSGNGGAGSQYGEANVGIGGGGGGGGMNADGSGSGGGVGLRGQGANGTATATGPGGAGSGGSGMTYGGGGKGTQTGTPGGSGAIRIIWPGTTRQFPSTNTGDM